MKHSPAGCPAMSSLAVPPALTATRDTSVPAVDPRGVQISVRGRSLVTTDYGGFA